MVYLSAEVVIFMEKSVKPDVELGTGKNNNIKIKKLSLLDKLEKCNFLQ